MTAPSVVIGVDAGGSHTTAVVADGAGRELGRAHGDAGAVRPGRATEAAQAIHDTCRQALETAGVPRASGSTPSPVSTLFVGAAGAGTEEPRRALTLALEALGLATRVFVDTDARVALEAAFGSGPGIVLLAGTGSIAWARLPDGSQMRVGGLGPLLGDGGSGHDIGLRGLRAALRATDGLGPATTLEGLLDAHEVAQSVRGRSGVDPRLIAMLAPVVFDAAAQGDAVAAGIVITAADALADHAAAASQDFPPDVPIPVALGGGLLRRAGYRTMVIARMQTRMPRLVVHDAPLDPPLGAVRLALRSSGATSASPRARPPG